MLDNNFYNYRSLLYDVTQLVANVVTIASIVYKFIPSKYLGTRLSAVVEKTALNRCKGACKNGGNPITEGGQIGITKN